MKTFLFIKIINFTTIGAVNKILSRTFIWKQLNLKSLKHEYCPDDREVTINLHAVYIHFILFKKFFIFIKYTT